MKKLTGPGFFIFSCLLLFVEAQSPEVMACATDLKSAPAHHETAWIKYCKTNGSAKKENLKAKRKISSDLTSWSQDRPWGGRESSQWKPEAIIANAASEALNQGFVQPGVQEVLVSVPVKMLYSNIRPYGDGQTNAAVTLGSFNAKYPPVVAAWMSYVDGSQSLNIRFSKFDGFISTGEILLDFADGSTPVLLGTGSSVQNGFYEISWKSPPIKWGDLFQNHVAYLQLPGGTGWFPLDFRDTAVQTSELLLQVPEKQRALSHGSLLDPELMSAQNANANANMVTVSPFAKMYPNAPNPSCEKGCPAGPKDFAGDLHAVRYSPVIGVHNEFTNSLITAVGNGDTTVVLPPSSPFKMAYLCFDARNLTAESQFGVPSGGGWHEIGDNAETVMNTLENGSPIFGYANGKPGDNREYAYGLSDVTVIRRLRPGMALVTAAGVTTTAEAYTDLRGTGVPSGRNYHWFAFDSSEEICAVEWVHPCIPNPTNHIGLDCSQ